MGMKKVIINNEKFELADETPQYGINYNKGYIGFCYDEYSFISKVIAKVTNYCCDTGIKVSHALIVVDDNTCIEADVGQKKVIISSLSKYFDNPEKIISFRKPRDISDNIADKIVQAAVLKVGCPYEFKQIVGHLGKSLPGINQFNKLTHNFIVDIISKIKDNPDEFICSELAAYCLKYPQDWKYHNKGILSRITNRINPQELFEDNVIFKDWKFEKIKEPNPNV